MVVHVEPSEPPGDLRERATAAASSVPEVREVHNVRVMHLPDGYELSLHVKLPSELSLTEAHGVVERLEALIRAAIPELRNVHTHIEPLAGHRLGAPARARRHDHRARGDRRDGPARDRRGSGDPVVPRRRAGPFALVTITLPGEQPLPSAHRHAGEIEEAVRERCPDARGRDRAHRARGGSRAAASDRGAYSRLTAAAAPTASSTPE